MPEPQGPTPRGPMNPSDYLKVMRETTGADVDPYGTQTIGERPNKGLDSVTKELTRKFKIPEAEIQDMLNRLQDQLDAFLQNIDDGLVDVVRNKCRIIIEDETDLPVVVMDEFPQEYKDFEDDDNAPDSMELPERLIVKGDMFMGESDFAYVGLPKYLKVYGSLISETDTLSKLPETLYVRDNLDVSHNTNIHDLPNRLSVGGDLDVRGTSVSELPADMQVGGSIDIRDTHIMRLRPNMVVKGDLNMAMLNLVVLPDNLQVTGSLNIRGIHTITELGPNLDVGILQLDHNTKITQIDPSVEIKKGIQIYSFRAEKFVMLADFRDTKVPEEFIHAILDCNKVRKAQGKSEI